MQTAPIGALTLAHVGQTFDVQGRVVAVSSASQGFGFTLDDGTGRIEMVLTRGALSKVTDYVGLNTGAEVQVTALVAQVDGVLKLQPRRGKDVSILAPGSSAGIPISAIDTLGDLNIGIVVAVEGSIIEVQPAVSNLTLVVADETGSVKVRLKNRVLQFVPNAAGLVVGARARVVGQIDFRRKTVLIVPMLGYDVTLR